MTSFDGNIISVGAAVFNQTDDMQAPEVMVKIENILGNKTTRTVCMVDIILFLAKTGMPPSFWAGLALTRI